MNALVMKAITDAAAAERLRTRPKIVYDDLILKMKSQAGEGHDYINFVFSDSREIVDEVLRMLIKEGYTWTRKSHYIEIRW